MLLDIINEDTRCQEKLILVLKIIIAEKILLKIHMCDPSKRQKLILLNRNKMFYWKIC